MQNKNDELVTSLETRCWLKSARQYAPLAKRTAWQWRGTGGGVRSFDDRCDHRTSFPTWRCPLARNMAQATYNDGHQSYNLCNGRAGARTQDSPDGRSFVIDLWEFGAFIANSLIFLDWSKGRGHTIYQRQHICPGYQPRYHPISEEIAARN
jgi:hypothetical protein